MALPTTYRGTQNGKRRDSAGMIQLLSWLEVNQIEVSFGKTNVEKPPEEVCCFKFSRFFHENGCQFE